MKNKGNFLSKFSNFSVNKYSKLTFSIPLIVIIVALIIIISIGATTGSYANAVGIGIDFEGGTMLNVVLGQEAIDNYDAHKEKIITEIEKHGVVVSYTQREEANNKAQTSIAFRYKNISNDDDEIAELNDQIQADINKLYEDTEIESFNINYQSIGATAAQDLISKAAIAIAVSCVLILIYIMIRFTMVSGFAAVFALLHDVAVMFALTIICRVQINTAFVAAVITIIAYSINNTIIIFDRCREYSKPFKGQKMINYGEIGDRAVRDNMTRSIYTTLTTMVTIIFLAALGSETIREFCVPIILGLLAGLYSSVFLATPMWSKMNYGFDKLKDKYSKRNEIEYSKSDVEEEVVKNYNDGEEKVTKVKSAGKKQNSKAKPVYKYSKKNTQFKKKK